jgi:predicted RNA binding protein YcfA (HicA-like mRNA interferase family)
MRKKDVEQFLRVLRRDGWRVERTNGEHWKLTPPGSGRMVFTGSTPSDHRAIKNLKAECRRAVSMRS